MNFTNYYRTLGLPDFSPIDRVVHSFEYNSKELKDPIALEELKLAHNVLGDPEIKGDYDIALQAHLTRIRTSLNYYAILNIPDFTDVHDEIYDGRFYEVMRFQPPADYAEALAYVAEAYEVLSDPEKKEKFDAKLKGV